MIPVIVIGVSLLASLGFNFYLVKLMQVERRYLLNYNMARTPGEMIALEKAAAPVKVVAQDPNAFTPPNWPIS